MKSLCSLGLCRKRKGRLKPTAGAFSDIGLRKANDDLVFAGDHCRLYVALDGIGGAAGGGEASRIVLEKLTVHVESMCESASGHPDQDLKSAISKALSDATQEMLQVAREIPEYDHMGTVFALAYIVDETLLYTRIGDARVYLIRQGRASQLTADETYVQLMVDVGVIEPEEVSEHPMRNLILNAVGTRSTETPPIVHSRLLLPEDIVLLTTDGVSDKLTEEDFGTLLSYDRAPDVLAEAVVNAALEAGTSDNASCVVIRVERAEDIDACRHDELHAELTKLHEILSDVESFDDELRSDMMQIAEDIRQALQSDADSDLVRLQKQISDRTLEFEVSHPHLTGVVTAIVDLLSRIGI